jgi:hypothetical protein
VEAVIDPRRKLRTSTGYFCARSTRAEEASLSPVATLSTYDTLPRIMSSKFQTCRDSKELIDGMTILAECVPKNLIAYTSHLSLFVNKSRLQRAGRDIFPFRHIYNEDAGETQGQLDIGCRPNQPQVTMRPSQFSIPSNELRSSHPASVTSWEQLFPVDGVERLGCIRVCVVAVRISDPAFASNDT